MDLLINKTVSAQLEQFIKSQAHALLISGPNGAGKKFVALNLAGRLLDVKLDKLIINPGFMRLRGGENSLGIDAVRDLRHFLQLKTSGKATIRRVIVIENSESMTIEAQNALLKILEEPPLDTRIILTENGERGLRSTIYSRVQHARLLAPSKTELIDFFSKQGITNQEIVRAYHLSSGQIGLMHSLLTQNTENILNQHVNLAKKLLGSTTYQRLIEVDSLVGKKEELTSLFYALKQVSRAALIQSIEKGDLTLSKRWHLRMQELFKAETSLKHKPNIKLLLSSLMVSL